MHSTTLSFANMHNHGELFANILRARRESFIVKNNWDLPETMGMEYDQYDTPVSRWLAVHDDTGRVLAGVRLTPTTARCGIYSYMVIPHLWGCLKLELRGHFILVQFHSGCDAAYSHVGAVVVVSP